MAIEPGQMLLHYRLVEEIGAGGMGVVWKAVDTNLDREVAIKVLPDLFSEDRERLVRFEREAKLLASLNHPNIAIVHGLHDAEGLRFLAMELVEGEDLSKRLALSPLSIEEALPMARQVAAALEAAHENGVVHRDLKPANIQLMSDGTVKVLDFGLAKAFEPDPTSADPSASPTVTSAGTVAGVLLGTAAYMSPEQARAQPVDKRCDIWSFGCVLLEALSGRKAFGGGTVSDTIAGILRGDPDWSGLPANTPRVIRRLLQRCLEKDARERLRDIGDARIELDRAIHGKETTGAAEADLAGASAGPWRVVAALIVGLAVGAAGWSWLGPKKEAPANVDEVTRLSMTIPVGKVVQDVQISGDGRTIAYIATSTADSSDGQPVARLYSRRLDQLEARLIPDSNRARWATFSPDGRWLAYFTQDEAAQRGQIRKIAVEGGPSLVVVDDAHHTGWLKAEWRADDTLLVAHEEGLARVSAFGGEPELVLNLTESVEPSVVLHTFSLPDEDTILVTIGFVREGGLQSRIEVLPLSTQTRRVLVENGRHPMLSPGGNLVFRRGPTVLAAPFDSQAVELRGPAVPIMQLRGPANVSAGGTLVHYSTSPPIRRLVTVDDEGRIARLERFDGVLDDGAGLIALRWSPDGSRLAATIFDEESRRANLWLHAPLRGAPTPLPFEDAFVLNAVWTADGLDLLLGAMHDDERYRVYRRRADGSGAPALYVESSETEVWDRPSDWHENGTLIFVRAKDENNDIWLSSADGETRSLIATTANETNPRLSRDGRWLAYSSDESGRSEIWVGSFSVDGSLGAKTRVSVGGGDSPCWSPDGSQLYFVDAKDRLMVASLMSDTGAGGAPVFSTPSLVVDRTALGLEGAFDVHPVDGRFVMQHVELQNEGANEIQVVLNWFAEVRRRLAG